MTTGARFHDAGFEDEDTWWGQRYNARNIALEIGKGKGLDSPLECGPVCTLVSG